MSFFSSSGSGDLVLVKPKNVTAVLYTQQSFSPVSHKLKIPARATLLLSSYIQNHLLTIRGYF
jgi:hypothetical protein